MKLKTIKLFISAILIVTLLMAAGCGGQKSYDSTTFVLNSDGTVTQYIVEENTGDYKLSDFKDYANSNVDAYNLKSGTDAVKISRLELKSNVFNIVMDYSSVNDYAAFNNVTCYNNTVIEAYKAGYSFDDSFTASNGTVFPGYTIPAEYPRLYVLVLQEPVCVSVPYEIVACSSLVQKNEDNEYFITSSPDANLPAEFHSVNVNPGYIIYKIPSGN